MKRTVTAGRGAKPAGSYSCATVPNDAVFVSGQGPFDSETNSASGAFTDQMRKTLENSSVAPKAAGTGLGKLAKVNAISRVSYDSPTPTMRTMGFWEHAKPKRMIACGDNISDLTETFKFAKEHPEE